MPISLPIYSDDQHKWSRHFVPCLWWSRFRQTLRRFIVRRMSRFLQEKHKKVTAPAPIYIPTKFPAATQIMHIRCFLYLFLYMYSRTLSTVYIGIWSTFARRAASALWTCLVATNVRHVDSPSASSPTCVERVSVFRSRRHYIFLCSYLVCHTQNRAEFYRTKEHLTDVAVLPFHIYLSLDNGKL